MSDGTLRIPMKPQTGLFALNLALQPALAVMFGWMALSDGESRGTRAFGAVFALIALGLFAFSALAFARTRGKTFEITLDDDALNLPIPLRAKEIRVPLAALKEARVQETRTATRSFWMLTLAWEEGGAKRGTVVASQFVGDDAFFALRDALTARGVTLT